ncbi:MAG TPA: hypothetical protein VGU43_05775 [Thermoplasmata archaeon]|nr:hypothetical protein [Thermoplasmata archaeon]
MEYVVLRAAHPTYLNLQLPTEVASLIELEEHGDRRRSLSGRTVAFLARGPGVVRVVAGARAEEILPVETIRRRLLANARLSEKLVFALPAAVSRHLGLHVQSGGSGEPRFTDDAVLWFLPSPEYYEFRARERARKGWSGPAGGGLARVYLSRSELPGREELDEMDGRITREEWPARLELVGHSGRGRPV